MANVECSNFDFDGRYKFIVTACLVREKQCEIQKCQITSLACNYCIKRVLRFFRERTLQIWWEEKFERWPFASPALSYSGYRDKERTRYKLFMGLLSQSLVAKCNLCQIKMARNLHIDCRHNQISLQLDIFIRTYMFQYLPYS